MYPDLHSFGK